MTHAITQLIDTLCEQKLLIVDFPNMDPDPVVTKSGGIETRLSDVWRDYKSAIANQDTINTDKHGKIIKAHLKVNYNTPPEEILNNPRIPHESDLYISAKSIIDQRAIDLQRKAESRLRKKKSCYRITTIAILAGGLTVGVSLIIRTKRFDDLLTRVFHPTN